MYDPTGVGGHLDAAFARLRTLDGRVKALEAAPPAPSAPEGVHVVRYTAADLVVEDVSDNPDALTGQDVDVTDIPYAYCLQGAPTRRELEGLLGTYRVVRFVLDFGGPERPAGFDPEDAGSLPFVPAYADGSFFDTSEEDGSYLVRGVWLRGLFDTYDDVAFRRDPAVSSDFYLSLVEDRSPASEQVEVFSRLSDPFGVDAPTPYLWDLVAVAIADRSGYAPFGGFVRVNPFRRTDGPAAGQWRVFVYDFYLNPADPARIVMTPYGGVSADFIPDASGGR